MQEELEAMTSRACKQKDKMMVSSKENFDVTLNLMKEDLKNKANGVVQLEKDFGMWEKERKR